MLWNDGSQLGHPIVHAHDDTVWFTSLSVVEPRSWAMLPHESPSVPWVPFLHIHVEPPFAIFLQGTSDAETIFWATMYGLVATMLASYGPRIGFSGWSFEGNPVSPVSPVSLLKRSWACNWLRLIPKMWPKAFWMDTEQQCKKQQIGGTSKKCQKVKTSFHQELHLLNYFAQSAPSRSATVLALRNLLFWLQGMQSSQRATSNTSTSRIISSSFAWNIFWNISCMMSFVTQLRPLEEMQPSKSLDTKSMKASCASACSPCWNSPRSRNWAEYICWDKFKRMMDIDGPKADIGKNSDVSIYQLLAA